MYGVAVGDALGATVEFMSSQAIKQEYGQLKDIIGGGWLGLRPGQWTDDTEMTIAVAEGVLVNPHDPVPEIGKRFLEWANTNPPDIGNTIRAAFSNYLKLGNWQQAAEALHKNGMRTAGNGALMRTLPIAFMYKDPADIYIMSMMIARMTHWDPEAGLTCCLYCLLAKEIIAGTKNKLVAWEKAKNTFLKLVPDKLSSIAEKLVLEKLFDIENWTKNQLNPSGYTVDSLACALWCFLKGENFEDTVVTAVNLGGDADTIGAITGGLAGVYWGFKAIPERWLATFSPEQKNRLEHIANSIKKLVII